MDYYQVYIKNPHVEQNVFINMLPEKPKSFNFMKIKKILPQPFWKNHNDIIQCYWKTWELAFKNIRPPTKNNGFIANYIDTAFNDCLFMWDSAFITMFGRYASQVFNFQRTLDNLYCKQHSDGFICREIDELNGSNRFEKFDPSSTGPNIMPWAEWEYFLNYDDKKRLANIFPVLLAYHQWLKKYRTWQNGTYWSTGWGCGMDNQPRTDDKFPQHLWHGYLSWIDICLQQIFSAKILIRIAQILNKKQGIKELKYEVEQLTLFVNKHMWDEKTAFYYDCKRDGKLSQVKTIGAYWALIAGIIPEKRLKRFIAHLENKKEFNRPHRIPSLSADHPEYKSNGSYWIGGVWPPTNYMVLKGLQQYGYNKLAYEIALNHLENVVKVFKKTNTLWENYAPEYSNPGNPAKKDFVGWSGLPATAVLFEFIFGLRPDVPHLKLIWDIHLLEEHGVYQYPFGENGLVNLKCLKRSSPIEKPVIEINSNIPLKLKIFWKNGMESMYLNVKQ